MSDIRLAIATDTAGIPNPEASAGEHHRRSEASLTQQRLPLDRLESHLGERLQQIVNEVAREIAVDRTEQLTAVVGGATDAASIVQRIEQFERQLAFHHEESERLRLQLQQARTATSKLKHKLRAQETLMAESQAMHEKKRLELAIANDQFADAQAQLIAARKRLDFLRQELEDQREQTFNDRQETKAQRRRIARELKARRASRFEDQEATKSEIARLQNELQEALADRDRIADQLSRRPAPSEVVNTAREDQLREEAKSLAAKLARAESRLSEMSLAGDAESLKQDELQTRLAKAVEELRVLHQTNFELETKLSKAGRDGGVAVPVIGTGMDWEAQKQRLLASLEPDGSDDEEDVAERNSIEATVRITDQIVANKDREIAELKQQLEEQTQDYGRAASMASGDLLDHDEVICQERKKLQQVQVEWHERISKAEIEISVERAKIARDRAELEEKNRLYQRSQSDHVPSEESGDGGKPVRGRWLARLGLKDLDEQSS